MTMINFLISLHYKLHEDRSMSEFSHYFEILENIWVENELLIIVNMGNF